MEKMKLSIAGEIAMRGSPGETMKKWRELFAISQAELAKHLKISSSTISDYESNRRKSPGINVIKRFVNALFEIDAKRGGMIAKKLSEEEKESDEYFEVHEFTRGILLSDFVELIGGKVLTNQDLLNEIKIYGYTLIDSIKVILEMPYPHFPKLYGSIGDKAFIFTGVSTGRSPLVVIRVAPTKPKAVVLFNLDKVDPLALKISEREKIPVIVTKMEISRIKEALSKI